jgi:sterol desaturase/sphingolipid hydroxylase (fatty acid hydroxylase superfamily)
LQHHDYRPSSSLPPLSPPLLTLPFLRTADHEKFIECYASSFRHWDWLFGTDKKYHATRERQRREREERKKL